VPERGTHCVSYDNNGVGEGQRMKKKKEIEKELQELEDSEDFEELRKYLQELAEENIFLINGQVIVSNKDYFILGA